MHCLKGGSQMQSEEVFKLMPLVQDVARKFSPEILVQLGILGGYDADLCYQIFLKGQRLSDFKVFSLIPNNQDEAHKLVLDAFERYLTHAKRLA
jgi:hypothetical protein